MQEARLIMAKDKVVPEQYRISLLDILCLLKHAEEYEKDELMSPRKFTKLFNTLAHKTIPIKRMDLESLLYYGNIAEEDGKFKHYKPITFEQFCNNILDKDLKLHPKYNFIVFKQKRDRS